MGLANNEPGRESGGHLTRHDPALLGAKLDHAKLYAMAPKDWQKLWRRIEEERRRKRALRRLLWTYAGVALVAWLALVAWFDRDDGGLFGQNVAAWLQGLGSLAAIAALVWQERRTAQRLETERTRRQHEDDVANAHRHAMIEECIEAVKEADAQMSRRPVDTSTVRLTQDLSRRLKVALDELERDIRESREGVPRHLQIAMAMSVEIMSHYRTAAEIRAHDPGQQQSWRERFAADVAALTKAYETWEPPPVL